MACRTPEPVALPCTASAVASIKKENKFASPELTNGHLEVGWTLEVRDRRLADTVLGSVADVKMEIPVPVRSLTSCKLSPRSFPFDKTFWGVVSAAVEQSRRKVNLVAQEDEKLGPEADPRIPPNQKQN